jgi:type 1 glutamine amidotransferase
MTMNRTFFQLLPLFVLSALLVAAPDGETSSAHPDPWRTKVEANLPTSLSAKPKKARKVLLYSTATGYKHAVIPRVQTVLKLLTEKTGAAELVISDDVELLTPEKIGQFDAIIFNNCCSNNKERNLFRDIYVHQVDKFARERATQSLEERAALAATIEKSVMDHVASGKGLMVIHGAIAIMNGSEEFSAMVGASFDYHPKAQELTLLPVEPGHPLLKAFDGKPLVHKDEPYLMKGAYKEQNFRPLLRFDGSKVTGLRAGNQDDECYVSWIKAHGKGRVFYVSPSHFEESYQDGRLLQYYLDGLQYVLGDLDCDDSVPQ